MLAAHNLPDASRSKGKRPLLPSELKKQLKNKRATGTPQIPATPTAKNISQPLGIKAQLPDPSQPVTKTPRVAQFLARPVNNWSISSKLTITTSQNPLYSSKASIDGLETLSESLVYHRFPYPKFPEDARTRIKKLILSKDEFERTHFRAIVDAWRKALLSLYSKFRTRDLDFFYLFQPEFTVLFRWSESLMQMEAIMTRVTRTTLNQLGQEGLCINAPLGGSVQNSEVDPLPSSSTKYSADNSEDSNDERVAPISKQRIRRDINRRLQQTQKKASVRRSVATSTVLIQGEVDVHCLIDFLLNQKEGKSYVILPELIAPESFLYGTMERTDYTITGPIDEGRYQLKATGIILPPTFEKFIDGTYRPDDSAFAINLVTDPRTDALLSFPLEKA